MIIPVRCFTCSKVLADKWEWYTRECEKLKAQQPEDADAGDQTGGGKSRAELLDRLGLQRICCRRHFLGHVDMMDLI